MYKFFINMMLIGILLFALSDFLLAKTVAHQGEQVDITIVEACLECHDDMQEHSHPVMIPYPPATTADEDKYPSVSEVIKSGIKIVDGKVTCITCHDLSNPEPMHPVKGMENSKLCLVCHNK